MRWRPLLVVLILSAHAMVAGVGVVPKPMQVEETRRTTTIRLIERELPGRRRSAKSATSLTRTGENIRIFAHRTAGLFYAGQTREDRRAVPSLRIVDRPRFPRPLPVQRRGERECGFFA